jgi:glycine/D-amino acid oxidase-like deaminating enzyme
VIHDRLGWWVREAGAPRPAAPLAGELEVDVAIVGGGYTGLWAAWHVLALEPGARVALLEAEVCGFGPSGRNGGFVSTLDLSLGSLRSRFGAAGAELVAGAVRDSAAAIGAWCEQERVDAWFRAAPHLAVATDAAQEVRLASSNLGEEEAWVSRLDARQVAEICASPVFRGARATAAGATVQPARLAFGLRARLLERGVRLYEGTSVRAVHRDGAWATLLTDAGQVRAGRVLLALGAGSGAVPSLRGRLTVGSSHLLITAPVPDVVASLGWTGGEAITDGRTLLHYLRTTPDGRIAFGWAGGRMGCGARRGGPVEVDAEVIAHARRELLRMFPALAEYGPEVVVHAWGGPVDVSPSHLPAVHTLGGGADLAAFGFTGSGVGASHAVGRMMAALALDRRDLAGLPLPLLDPPRPRPPLPPEPLRWAGAALVRRALIRVEDAQERSEAPALQDRLVAGLPERLGMRLVR